jgi:hypothetical protein
LGLLLGLIAAGCTVVPIVTTPTGPTPISAPSPTALQAAQLVLVAAAPARTPADAGIQLVVLDLVTGLPYNSTSYDMEPRGDGQFEATLTPPAGSLLVYRFTRQSPSVSEEFDLEAQPVRYRLAYVAGPTHLEETMSAWSDSPAPGASGRIEGRLIDRDTKLPLPEFIVSAGGAHTFSDGEGIFHLDGLAPGTHTLIAVAPDGSYRPVQQGAVVAARSETPAELEMSAAPATQVTFEVTVPSDTVAGIPVRVAGNVRQLGATFGELAGGLTTTASRMPTLVMVDPTHYLMILDLHAGTDLRYKYTLGDGLWNAERNGDGSFHTRQVIVPENGLLIQDTVATWHGGGQGPVTFQVTAPGNTPEMDTLAVQFKPLEWMEPLPMWRQGNSDWTFVLFSPLDFSGSLSYRACLNYQCGLADDAEHAGPGAGGRAFTPSDSPQEVASTVSAWHLWEGDPPVVSIIAPEILQVPGYEAGVQWLPEYRPNWLPLAPRAVADAVDMAANSLTLSPAWVIEPNVESPRWGFDPIRSPFAEDLALIAAEAQRQGLQVSLRPSLVAHAGSVADWWIGANRTSLWWDDWFEAYRSLALTYAGHASQIGTSRLVLGGAEFSPALPGGRLADGSLSGSPSDSELRWRELLAEVRSRFDGRLVLELEMGNQTAPVPSFVELVDEVRVVWRFPLGSSEGQDFPAFESSAGSAIDQIVLGTPVLAGKRLILVVEIASVEGGALGCVPVPEGGCRPAADFDLGAEVDADLPVDLVEQAEAINALLLQSYQHPEIGGLIVSRYNPAVWLRDKSASIGGKPARDVLWYWYPRLIGP